MKGHQKVEGLVLSTLEKLPGIKSDLTRNDENWKLWTFDELLKELRIWLKRNYVDHSMGSFVNDKVTDHTKYKSKSFLTSTKRGPDVFTVLINTGLTSVTKLLIQKKEKSF